MYSKRSHGIRKNPIAKIVLRTFSGSYRAFYQQFVEKMGNLTLNKSRAFLINDFTFNRSV